MSAVLLLSVGLPVAAQTETELGYFSCGRLATEVTAYVRCAQMPAALYAGIGQDVPFAGQVAVTLKASVSVQTLEIYRCDAVPCRPLGRFARYRGKMMAEPLFVTATPKVGLRWRPRSWGSAAAGLAVPVVYCPYIYCGASPMVVLGGWVDGRVSRPIGSARLGVSFTALDIPPSTPVFPRWTTFSEWSGYKTGDWPRGRNDPLNVVWYELGIFLQHGR